MYLNSLACAGEAACRKKRKRAPSSARRAAVIAPRTIWRIQTCVASGKPLLSPVGEQELVPGRGEGAQVRAAAGRVDVALDEQRVAEDGALAAADRVRARRRRVAAPRGG